MKTKKPNVMWFAVPALIVAGLITAISIPELDSTMAEVGSDSLATPIIAMAILALGVGALAGALFYAVPYLRFRKALRNLR